MIARTPAAIPIVADGLDADSVYDAPGEEYDGVLALEREPGGTIAAGFNPKQSSLFGAQSLNAMGRDHGRALDAVVDLASYQHERLTYDAGSDRLHYADVAGTGSNSNDEAGDPPLLMAGSDGWVYALLENMDSGAGHTRKFHPGAGKGLLGDGGVDTAAWTVSASPGLTPAESGRACVVGADRGSEYMIALGATRTVKVSADRGATWDDGEDLPTNANWAHALVAVALPDARWLVCDYCPTTTHVNRVVVSNNLAADAAWTTITGSVASGNDGGAVRRITFNSQVAIFLPHTNTSIGRWEYADSEVSTIALADPDTSRHRWRGAWNEQIQEFMIGNAQGDLWASDATGESWTLVNEEEIGGFGVADIVAHGRGFIVSNSYAAELWYVHYDMHGNVQKDRICQAFRQGTSSSLFHLVNVEGRWFAGRVNAYAITGGMGNLRYVLEPIISGVSPWDIAGAVGR